MSAHGGKRMGAGRPKGSVKKSTKLDEFNLAMRAGELSEEMIKIISNLARNSKSDSIRLSAAIQILDRAHGKPAQNKMPDPVDEVGEAMLAIGRQLGQNNLNIGAPLMGPLAWQDVVEDDDDDDAVLPNLF